MADLAEPRSSRSISSVLADMNGGGLLALRDCRELTLDEIASLAWNLFHGKEVPLTVGLQINDLLVSLLKRRGEWEAIKAEREIGGK